MAPQIAMEMKDREGGGDWQVFLPVKLGQRNGEALPHFTFSGIITFVYATDSEVIVGYVALLQQPAVGKGAIYERFSGKRLSFLLVSMCTGWMEYITGFEDIY